MHGMNSSTQAYVLRLCFVEFFIKIKEREALWGTHSAKNRVPHTGNKEPTGGGCTKLWNFVFHSYNQSLHKLYIEQDRGLYKNMDHNLVCKFIFCLKMLKFS